MPHDEHPDILTGDISSEMVSLSTSRLEAFKDRAEVKLTDGEVTFDLPNVSLLLIRKIYPPASRHNIAPSLTTLLKCCDDALKPHYKSRC